MTANINIPASLRAKIDRAVAAAIDPDYRKYPHLFRVYRIPNKEIIKHQERELIIQCEAKPGEPQANALPNDLELSRYNPISGVFKIIPKTTLKQAGWRKIAGIVQCAQPQEFIDTETGEILTNRDIFMRSINVGIGYSISERYLGALVTFDECTEKELPFIRFVLCARNKRGGLIMDIHELVNVWLDIKGIEAKGGHLARKRRSMIDMLKKRKILANDTTLTPHFQLRAKVSRKEAVQEETDIVRLVDPRPKPGCSLEEKYLRLFPESANLPRWTESQRRLHQQYAGIERGIWAGCWSTR
ncbi:hypothetical protein PQR66_03275 [Paraburkholderia agricolaris]|uniref:Uncharacterized protein n=1 Tax=Paraburkholderia agricolaris TaxID=2152888 RepID=A0ABW8ZJ93_9BURK